MKWYRLFFVLLGSGVVLCANAGECQTIKFSDGRSVAMRSAFVKTINATMEAPQIKVFSVSIILPIGERFTDVSSIVVEPESVRPISRRNICMLDGGMPNCASYVASSGVSVSIYFGTSRGTAREALLQKVRDYVDKEVLTCP